MVVCRIIFMSNATLVELWLGWGFDNFPLLKVGKKIKSAGASSDLQS